MADEEFDTSDWVVPPPTSKMIADAVADCHRYAYRDGATMLVGARAFDALCTLFKLPRVDGREVGQIPEAPQRQSVGDSGGTEK